MEELCLKFDKNKFDQCIGELRFGKTPRKYTKFMKLCQSVAETAQCQREETLGMADLALDAIASDVPINKIGLFYAEVESACVQLSVSDNTYEGLKQLVFIYNRENKLLEDEIITKDKVWVLTLLKMIKDLIKYANKHF